MEISYRSDLGKVRENNEDYVGKFTNKAGIVMVIVADGLGGHNGGEVASEMAVSHLGYYFSETSFFSISQASAWLNKKVDEENKLILKNSLQYRDLRGMGTTLVVAIIFEQEILLAHIGDSRGYIFDFGKLKRVTEDHSLVNELIKEGEISPEEAENHPRKNIITRSLGISETSKLDENIFPIKKGSILMLCTDGLTNMLSDMEIQRILNISESLSDKCCRLIDEANEAGGTDNISVLLVSFNKEVNA